MISPVSHKLRALAIEMGKLAEVTGCVGWDKDPDEIISNPTDLGAKPIPRNVWLRAFLVANPLAKLLPSLDAPIPGADPDGFVWLTWERGSLRFALEVRANKYVWTRTNEMGPARFESARLEDVAEALRALFGHEAN